MYQSHRKSIFHYFLFFWNYSPLGLSAYLLTSIVTGLLESLGITLIIPLFNFFIDQDNSSQLAIAFKSAFNFIGINFNLENLLIVILVIFSFKAIANLFIFYIRIYLRSRFARHMQFDLIKLYSNIDYLFYKKLKVSNVNNVLVKEVNAVESGFDKFSKIITSSINLFIYVSTIFAISQSTIVPSLVILGLILFPVVVKLGQLIRDKSARITNLNHKVQELFLQVLNGYKYLKATATFEIFLKKIKLNLKIRQSEAVKSFMFSSAPTLIQELVAVIFICGIIYWQVVLNSEALSEVIVLVALLYKSITGLMTFVSNRNSFWSDIGGLDSFLKMKEDFQNHQSKTSDNSLSPMVNKPTTLSFENVCFSYESQQVLTDVSFDIKPGEFVGIVGPSGSGKTTIFDLSLGLLNPNQGTITLNGQDISKINTTDLSKNLAFVPQDPILFNENIHDNIFLDNQAKANQFQPVIDNLLGALSKRELDVSGDIMQSLSGGQKQKISFLRELCKESGLLLVDEGTSALDSKSEEDIVSLLQTIRGKSTIFMIAHRLSSLKTTDRILVLDNGTIIENGTWSELANRKDGEFSKLVRSQNLGRDNL